ncbi:hypothetical protein [Nitratireductor pacificus]|uniref:Transmembrane protein n=1 Tax=Nitratireductor pacificus pht-3B TaxID=391937 RepID=K2MBP8_9HYPH|nr:hypothetical protein [Nitratireductor pacificus]EKF19561.1 hypothetical protein NA2_06692 [Nitratireductor pacificus pht-3B]
MSRTFTILLSIYWTACFAFTAWAAALADDALSAALAPVPETGEAWGLVAGIALVLAHSLVSVLFLWTLVVCVLERDGEASETEQVARLACTAALAVLLTTALYGAAVRGGGGPGSTESIPLLAILATYLAIRFEKHDVGSIRLADAVRPQKIARLNALNAVHGTLLERLATPRDLVRMPPANDDRIS